MPKKRSIVYVDGFNLYYGALRGGSHKWLDLDRFFRLLRNDDNLQRIRYFTTRISGPTKSNQERYLRALTRLPLVDILEGRFKLKEVRCRVKSCTFSGSRTFRIPEEKRTDVAIAVHMMDDAYEDRCDTFVLVSGDSDLVPSVTAVKARFPQKQVIVYVPTRNPIRGAAAELRAAADKHRDLPLGLLKRSQFPHRVPDGSGRYIDKPASW